MPKKRTETSTSGSPGVQAAKSGIIRAGIGGWTFEPWRGVFYPDKLAQAKELHYASRQLPTHRSQRHLLSHAKTGDVCQLGE